MLVLPTEKQVPVSNNPKLLLLFGKPKTGKTSFVASLEDNLIIDLEGGSNYLSAMAVQARTVVDIGEIVRALKTKAKEDTTKKPYKYITIDSGTALEEIAVAYGLTLYQQTPMAKLKDGSLYSDSILKLPKGAGYLYLREAFEKLYKSFIEFCDHLIIICHCKDSMIDKDGKEMSEMSIDLSGKIARILSSKSDAIGYVFRKENKTIINFNGGGDIICEARQDHLRGKEIVVAESDELNNLTFYPERIFI